MTKQEQKVLDKLTEAWNAFLVLPNQHNDDATEFRHALHQLQYLILSRPERRRRR